MVAATSGQELGSYTMAKSLYSTIGNGNKLKKNNSMRKNNLVIDELENVRGELDFMPLYEERDGHVPADWERRREALSQWLVNMTTVEVADVRDVDTGMYRCLYLSMYVELYTFK